jgi:hypothetical protein
MSSPPPPSTTTLPDASSKDATSVTEPGDAGVDAEMTDNAPPAGGNTLVNGTSPTADQDMTEAQAPSQPQHNRKDATLREFLAKMDDYAPIVSLPRPCFVAYCYWHTIYSVIPK